MLESVIITVVKFIVIVGVAVAGVFVGKALRTMKDNKTQRKEAGNE